MNLMKKRTGVLVAIFGATFLLSAMLVFGQQPEPTQGPKPPPQAVGPKPPRPHHDPFADALFPAELVMRHARELALTDEQKTFIRGEINRASTRNNELQWQLQDDIEALHETTKANSVNEQLALAQLDKVLESERPVKRAHMELMIRIKNKLTPEQQTKLHGLRHEMKRPPAGPGHGPGPGGPRPGMGGLGGPGMGGPPPTVPPVRPGQAPPAEPLIR
jgi:Spy/CpxP family protein refolding chaperone